MLRVNLSTRSPGHMQTHVHTHTYTKPSVRSVPHIWSFRRMWWGLEDIISYCHLVRQAIANYHSKCPMINIPGRSPEINKKKPQRDLGEILISMGHGGIDANGKFVTGMIDASFPNILQSITFEDERLTLCHSARGPLFL